GDGCRRQVISGGKPTNSGFQRKREIRCCTCAAAAKEVDVDPRNLAGHCGCKGLAAPRPDCDSDSGTRNGGVLLINCWSIDQNDIARAACKIAIGCYSGLKISLRRVRQAPACGCNCEREVLRCNSVVHCDAIGRGACVVIGVSGSSAGIGPGRSISEAVRDCYV